MENYSKFKSRRFLVALWAMLVISFVLIYSLLSKYEPNWIGIASPLLIAIPSVYIASESYTKPKMNKESNDNKNIS